MKTSYHVWFSARAPEDEQELLEAVENLMAQQLRSNGALAYRLHHFYNKGGSETLTDFQLVVDYQSREAQEEAMQNMNADSQKEPHASIMRLTGNFSPAWSEY